MNDEDSRDDAALLGAADDAVEAFAVFYRRHVDVVLRLCARRGLKATEAADVTAETFIAALRDRGGYRLDSGSARSWLLGIAGHKLSDHSRRRARDRRALHRLAFEPIELSERDYADYAELLAQESVSVVEDALAALPDGQRAAIRARVVEGESYEAIARELSVSEAVARQRVSRGLAALRTKLGREARMRDFVDELERRLLLAGPQLVLKSSATRRRQRSAPRLAVSLVALAGVLLGLSVSGVFCRAL